MHQYCLFNVCSVCDPQAGPGLLSPTLSKVWRFPSFSHFSLKSPLKERFPFFFFFFLFGFLSFFFSISLAHPRCVRVLAGHVQPTTRVCATVQPLTLPCLSFSRLSVCTANSVCRNWATTGFCTYGDRCNFAHHMPNTLGAQHIAAPLSAPSPFAPSSAAAPGTATPAAAAAAAAAAAPSSFHVPSCLHTLSFSFSFLPLSPF